MLLRRDRPGRHQPHPRTAPQRRAGRRPALRQSTAIAARISKAHAVVRLQPACRARARSAAADRRVVHRQGRPITKGWPTGSRSTRNCTTTAPVSCSTPLAAGAGKQGKSDVVVAWTNNYMGKTKVFATTLGHNNETVADARYLDLVTRGLLWSVDKLNDSYLKSAK